MSATRNALALLVAALACTLLSGFVDLESDAPLDPLALTVGLALLVGYLVAGIGLLVWDGPLSDGSHLEQIHVHREGDLYRVLARRFLRADERQKGPSR